MQENERLNAVVAAVDRVTGERGGRLSREALVGALRELDLDDTQVAEAIREIQQRERRRARLRTLAIVAVGAGLLVTGAAFWSRTQRFAGTEIIQVRVTPTGARDEESPPVGASMRIARGTGEAKAHITLYPAPTAARAPMRCEWADPTGRVVHVQQWETNSIDDRIFVTHCAFVPAADAPAGTWKVRVFLDGREYPARDVYVE